MIYATLPTVSLEHVTLIMGSVVARWDMKDHFVNTVWMSARPAPVKMEGHVWMDIKTIAVNVSLHSQVCIAFHGFDF